MTKTCRKCGKTLSLDAFYVHQNMKDGHLNICKDCTKESVALYRQKNIDKIRGYDRSRSLTEKRKKLRLTITRKKRLEIPNYQKAHNLIDKAVSSGKIIRPIVCEVCGEKGKTEGHHYDYARPEYVIWLCPACHKQYHLGKSSRAQEIRNAVDARIPF